MLSMWIQYCSALNGRNEIQTLTFWPQSLCSSSTCCCFITEAWFPSPSVWAAGPRLFRLTEKHCFNPLWLPNTRGKQSWMWKTKFQLILSLLLVPTEIFPAVGKIISDFIPGEKTHSVFYLSTLGPLPSTRGVRPAAPILRLIKDPIYTAWLCVWGISHHQVLGLEGLGFLMPRVASALAGWVQESQSSLRMSVILLKTNQASAHHVISGLTNILAKRKKMCGFNSFVWPSYVRGNITFLVRPCIY